MPTEVVVGDYSYLILILFLIFADEYNRWQVLEYISYFLFLFDDGSIVEFNLVFLFIIVDGIHVHREFSDYYTGHFPQFHTLIVFPNFSFSLPSSCHQHRPPTPLSTAAAAGFERPRTSKKAHSSFLESCPREVEM